MAALGLLVALLGLFEDRGFLPQEARTHLAGQPQRMHQRPGRLAELADRQDRIFSPATSDAPSPRTDD
jgi:hypothetical protein